MTRGGGGDSGLLLHVRQPMSGQKLCSGGRAAATEHPLGTKDHLVESVGGTAKSSAVLRLLLSNTPMNNAASTLKSVFSLRVDSLLHICQ